MGPDWSIDAPGLNEWILGCQSLGGAFVNSGSVKPLICKRLQLATVVKTIAVDGALGGEPHIGHAGCSNAVFKLRKSSHHEVKLVSCSVFLGHNHNGRELCCLSALS